MHYLSISSMVIQASAQCAAAGGCPRRQILVVLAAILCAAASGCGTSEATVSGEVTLDGAPLRSGVVTFHPKAGPAAYGRIQTDGSYTLSTGDKTGLQPGNYRVTVVATKAVKVEDMSGEEGPPPLTPSRYHRLETTPLEFTVEPRGNWIPLELTRSDASNPP